MRQSAEQPSSGLVLPSSQASSSVRMPSPHCIGSPVGPRSLRDPASVPGRKPPPPPLPLMMSLCGATRAQAPPTIIQQREPKPSRSQAGVEERIRKPPSVAEK